MAEYIDFEADVSGSDIGDDDIVMFDYDRILSTMKQRIMRSLLSMAL